MLWPYSGVRARRLHAPGGRQNLPCTSPISSKADGSRLLGLFRHPALLPSTIFWHSAGHMAKLDVTDVAFANKDSWREEVAALRAEVQQLRAEAGNRAATEVNNLENIYSYAVHAAVTSSPISALIACVYVGLVAVSATVLAFTYYDSSWLEHEKATMGVPYFSDIGAVNFYPDSSNPSGRPHVVNIAATIGVFLLCTMARAEDVETLSTPNPAVLIFCHFKSFRGCCFWRVLPLLFIQFCWVLRALLCPLFLVLGVGHALASSESALDIVLNAGAASFILDLDQMGYTLLVQSRVRDKYEKSEPPLISPLLGESTDMLTDFWSWLLWVQAIVASLLVLYNGTNAIVYDEMRTLLLVRGAVLGLAHAHIAFSTWRATSSSSSSTGTDLESGMSPSLPHMLAGLAVSVALSILLAAFVAYKAIYVDLFDQKFGWQFSRNPCLRACLNQYPADVNSTCFAGLLSGCLPQPGSV